MTKMLIILMIACMCMFSCNNYRDSAKKMAVSYCEEVQESTIQKERQKLLAPGYPPDLVVKSEVTRAILAAIETLKTDSQIPEDKRLINNYDIELREGTVSFYVYFRPRKLTGEMAKPGGSTSLGKYVTYEVNKSSYQVTLRQHYK